MLGLKTSLLFLARGTPCSDPGGCRPVLVDRCTQVKQKSTVTVPEAPSGPSPDPPETRTVRGGGLSVSPSCAACEHTCVKTSCCIPPLLSLPVPLCSPSPSLESPEGWLSDAGAYGVSPLG